MQIQAVALPAAAPPACPWGRQPSLPPTLPTPSPTPRTPSTLRHPQLPPPRQGCYCAHALRFFPGLEPSEVVTAAPKGVLRGCDTGMDARVAYAPPGAAPGAPRLVGSLEADLRHRGLVPVTTLVAEGTR
jgi:hypothetical protein